MIFEIRKARRSDLPALTRLLAEMDGESPLPAARAARLFAEIARYPRCGCYIAFERGTPVGTFSLLIFPTLVHRGGFEAVLDAVVVSASRRGKGIGARMMKEAARICAGFGCYKLMLSSNSKRVDAHRFYRRLGFAQHGVSFSLEPARPATVACVAVRPGGHASARPPAVRRPARADHRS